MDVETTVGANHGASFRVGGSTDAAAATLTPSRLRSPDRPLIDSINSPMRFANDRAGPRSPSLPPSLIPNPISSFPTRFFLSPRLASPRLSPRLAAESSRAVGRRASSENRAASVRDLAKGREKERSRERGERDQRRLGFRPSRTRFSFVPCLSLSLSRSGGTPLCDFSLSLSLSTPERERKRLRARMSLKSDLTRGERERLLLFLFFLLFFFEKRGR